MIIKDIQIFPIRVPILDEGCHNPAFHMSFVHSDEVIVKIIGEDGTYGIGEAAARLQIYGETIKSIVAIVEDVIKPRLIGEDSLDIQKLTDKCAGIKCNYCAKAAVDIALHDLNGKQLGLPVYRMLGGPVRTEVALSWTMSGTRGKWDDQMEEFSRKVSEGYRSFKFKIGAGCEQDIRFLKTIKGMAPDDCHIYADANTIYSRREAYSVMKELEGVIDAVEEPLPINDDQGRVDLAKSVNVDILIDESALTPEDVYRQIKLGAVGRVGIKVTRTGFTGSGRIAHMAEAAALPVQICTQIETDIGSAAALQVAAAFGNISLPCELAFYTDNYPVCFLKTPLKVSSGVMQVPQGPGLGVEVDWDMIEKYRLAP